jgi:hypothetical protein
LTDFRLFNIAVSTTEVTYGRTKWKMIMNSGNEFGKWSLWHTCKYYTEVRLQQLREVSVRITGNDTKDRNRNLQTKLEQRQLMLLKNFAFHIDTVVHLLQI